MSDADVKVLFMPSGRRGFFPRGTPLLDAARSLGVDIDSVCGGRGLCGRCQISCVTGSFAKHQIESDVDHLSPFSATEAKFVERKGPLKDGRRLSCHTTLLDDAVIDVPAESQVHRQIVRKEMEARDIRLDTATRLYYVQIAMPSLEDPRGELQLLLEALEREWGVSGVSLAPTQLQSLQAALTREDRGITVAVYQEHLITGIWPGLFDQPRGIAIDVGSTTVAAHLCDLNTGEVLASAGVMNPQIRYGEDLMSRVSYVMMHPEGAELLTSAIREAINGLFGELSAQASGAVTDILEIALVANPIMHHILLGINPVNLGTAPFALTTSDPVDTRAAEVGPDLRRAGIDRVAGGEREGGGAQIYRVNAEQDVVHDRICDQRDLENIGDRARRLSAELSEQAVDGLPNRAGQQFGPLGVHHHVGHAAHQILAVANLRIHDAR